MSSLPSYRLHRQSGQAIVTVKLPDGRRKDVLLGKFGSADSKAEYRRVLAEMEAGTFAQAEAAKAPDSTVNELMVHFLKFAKGYYPAGSYEAYKDALAVLKRLYGHTRAAEFGPLALKTCRQHLLAAGLARSTINKRVMQVRRFFKWCASEELLPAALLAGLNAVEGLRAGRSADREPVPVRPPDPAHVAAVLPLLPPPVRAMAELQLLTGARPGELVALRPADIDRSGAVWAAALARHKTTYKGKGRVLYFGPRAQTLLAPLVLRAGDDYLFSPARWEAERNAAKADARVTPKYPSHMKRNAAKRAGDARRRKPGRHYTVGSYREAIARGCERAGVPAWNPHQLRHAAATELRKEFGVELARVILGHSTAFTTEIYAEVDRQKALDAVAKVG